MIKFLKVSVEDICDQIDLTDMSYKNFGAVIRFKEHSSVKRYYYNSPQSARKEFQRNAEILFDFFLKLLNEEKINKLYIASDEELCFEIKRSNVLHSIKKKGKAIFTDEVNVIKDAFYMALRYELSPVFISEDHSIAIMPTDHLDMFIASEKRIEPECHNLLETVPWEL